MTVGRISAACFGYALEFYDFTIYSFFAAYIGRTFFPSRDPFVSLLLAVATFGIGFFMRPIGSVVIGRMSDRVGRRPALMLTIVLMTIGTLCVAITPGYRSIGIAAPVIVIIGRLVQGFALGGEMGPAALMLIEMAPANSRCFSASWLLASQGVSTLVGGSIGVGLSAMLSADSMSRWGWRLPFIVGLLIIPVGIYIRRNLPETLVSGAVLNNPVTLLFTRHWRLMAAALTTAGSLSVSIYIGYFMSTYALTTLKLPPTNSAAATVFAGIAVVIGSLCGGRLADRYGRKAVLIWPRIALTIGAIPLFWLLNIEANSVTLMLVTAIIIALTLLGMAGIFTLIPEALPPTLGATGLSIVIAVSTSVFGGTAQVIVVWLQRFIHDPLAAAYYLVLTSVFGLIGMHFLPETMPREEDSRG